MRHVRGPVVFFFAGVFLLSACPVADGQTKFALWFRERVGERTSGDEAQAKEDAAWRKKFVPSAEAQEKLVAAVKAEKSKCNFCHVPGESDREQRNPFGATLSTLLREQLSMDADAITDALKSSAPDADQQKVTKAFYECLNKALAKPVDPEKKEVGTYADRVKQGILPFVPE
jgi:hypothetical protein